MARIRSVHPGLLTDESFMALTVEQPLAVVLYLGLLMESDDHGIFEWKPLTLKARVLPAVPDSVASLLDVLVENRFVMSYELDGRKLGAVRNFCRFQRPKKPNPIHPKTDQVREWVACEVPEEGNPSPTSSPPVPHRTGSGTENPPQMEDGGGSRKKEPTPPSSETARLRVGLVRAFEAGNNPTPPDTSRAEVWIAQGFDPELCLSVVRTVLATPSGQKATSLSYFEPAIKRAHEERPAPARKADPAEPRVRFGGNVEWPESTVRQVLIRWKENPATWPSAIGDPPDQPGCKIPRHLLEEIAA